MPQAYDDDARTKRVLEMHSRGVQRSIICRLVGLSDQIVHCIVDPSYKDRLREIHRASRERMKLRT